MIRSLPAFVSTALRPLPLLPLQPPLDALLNNVLRRCPLVFDRLGEHASKRFGIEPTDLPFAFLLEPRRSAPRVTIVRRLQASRLDARIAGPLAGLVGLIGGAYDGDALFFSRDIMVEGDISAIIALRNAIEDAGVDLIRDGAACLGPLGPFFESAARTAAILAERLIPTVGAWRWN